MPSSGESAARSCVKVVAQKLRRRPPSEKDLICSSSSDLLGNFADKDVEPAAKLAGARAHVRSFRLERCGEHDEDPAGGRQQVFADGN